MIPSADVHHDPQDVSEQLAHLAVPEEALRRAIWRAYGEHRLLTPHDPAWYAGGVLPGKTMRYLRDLLVPGHGWAAETDAGLEIVVRPDREIALVVWSGDVGTGDVRCWAPSTRRPRGEASRVVVETNEQQVLFGELPAKPPRYTWALLVRGEQDGVQAELSMPMSVSGGGVITEWRTRIILGVIDGGDPVRERITPAPKQPFVIRPIAQ